MKAGLAPPAIIVGYVAVWAVAHSLLASLGAKRWARRVLGPPAARWYRLFFVAVAVVSLIPLLILWVILPDRRIYIVPSPWRWLMLLGQLVAAGCLVVAVVQAGVAHFLGLAQLVAANPEATGMLQVRGFYTYVRHPLYLFSMILIWLSPVMTLNRAALYASVSLYFILGSYHEESLLAHEYGQAYVDYREQVPRFVPWPGRVYKRVA